jgi:hypothetical protein
VPQTDEKQYMACFFDGLRWEAPMKRTDASGVRRGLTTLTLLLALGVVIGLASGLLAVMLKVVERFMMG